MDDLTTGSDSNLARLALLYSLPKGRPVWGVSLLAGDVYVVRERSPEVELYRYTGLQRRLPVPGLKDAKDMAACERNGCLYVTDVGSRDMVDYSVFRIARNGKVTKWPLEDKPWGVSVTHDSTVLVTCFESGLVLELNSSGHILHEIRLPPEVVRPLHAVRTTSGHLIVGHGDGPDAVHRVCCLDQDPDGTCRLVHTSEQWNQTPMRDDSALFVSGSSILTATDNRSPTASPGPYLGSPDVPGHLAVDSASGSLLVADVNNNRIVLTRPQLDCGRVLLELEDAREYPVRMYLDQMGRRLYVAYNSDVKNGRWTVGRVLVFFCFIGSSSD